MRNYGLLPKNAKFEVSLFNRSTAFDAVLKFCEKEGCLKPIRGKRATNGFLRMWLPYALLETLSKTSQKMVFNIQQELIGKSVKDLESEVEEWLQINRKGLGGLEAYRYVNDAKNAALGFIPILGQAIGLYNLFRSWYFINSMSKTRVSTVAELIGIATASELGVANINLRYKAKRFWISFFRGIFKAQSTEDDKSWNDSQREMGAWTGPWSLP